MKNYTNDNLHQFATADGDKIMHCDI